MSKFIGDVSAYAYAVSKGYTGTEEEFAELMASYADVGQTAVDAKDAAVAAKTAAQTAAGTATNKASEATTAAQTTTTKAAEAQADADAAALDASQALSAASTATTKATEATTAAATAVSAKDDAVAANTAAQSAKTAAQTAQTGAETAAASVEASAEQIATNAEDISQLKSKLTQTEKNLSYDISEIRADGTKNLFNDDVLKSISNVAYSEGVFSGASNKFSPNYLMQSGFEENKRYAVSLYGKNTGSNTVGNGLGLRVNYTNGTYGIAYLPNSTTDFTRLKIFAESGRTVQSIQFDYNSGGDNVWQIKDIQVEESTTGVTDYVPYYTAFDRVARKIANGNTSEISAINNIALESSEISIDSPEELAEYPSFNNFPINKIIHLAGNYMPTDGPRGYVYIGHNNLDSGTYSAVVLTYSVKTSSSAICQICVFYNDNYDYDKKPRTATRYGRIINGATVWTEWSTMSENTVLHASDKVVDINSYQTVTFSDFNDAPPNTMFQVDMNCGSTILNNPSPGHSGMLMTLAFSPIQRHALVQHHYALEGDDIAMYIRYSYKQDADTFIWTPWKKVVTE